MIAFLTVLWLAGFIAWLTDRRWPWHDTPAAFGAVVDEAGEAFPLGEGGGADAFLLLLDDGGAELGDEHAETHGEEDHDE